MINIKNLDIFVLGIIGIIIILYIYTYYVKKNCEGFGKLMEDIKRQVQKDQYDKRLRDEKAEKEKEDNERRERDRIEREKIARIPNYGLTLNTERSHNDRSSSGSSFIFDDLERQGLDISLLDSIGKDENGEYNYCLNNGKLTNRYKESPYNGFAKTTWDIKMEQDGNIQEWRKLDKAPEWCTFSYSNLLPWQRGSECGSGLCGGYKLYDVHSSGPQDDRNISRAPLKLFGHVNSLILVKPLAVKSENPGIREWQDRTAEYLKKQEYEYDRFKLVDVLGLDGYHNDYPDIPKIKTHILNEIEAYKNVIYEDIPQLGQLPEDLRLNSLIDSLNCDMGSAAYNEKTKQQYKCIARQDIYIQEIEFLEATKDQWTKKLEEERAKNKAERDEEMGILLESNYGTFHGGFNHNCCSGNSGNPLYKNGIDVKDYKECLSKCECEEECNYVSFSNTYNKCYLCRGPCELRYDVTYHTKERIKGGKNKYHCDAYVKRYPDLGNVYGRNCKDKRNADSLYSHYKRYGRNEKRNPGIDMSKYSCNAYLTRYPDLVSYAGGDNCRNPNIAGRAVQHYNWYGYREGRDASSTNIELTHYDYGFKCPRDVEEEKRQEEERKRQEEEEKRRRVEEERKRQEEEKKRQEEEKKRQEEERKRQEEEEKKRRLEEKRKRQEEEDKEFELKLRKASLTKEEKDKIKDKIYDDEINKRMKESGLIDRNIQFQDINLNINSDNNVLSDSNERLNNYNFNSSLLDMKNNLSNSNYIFDSSPVFGNLEINSNIASDVSSYMKNKLIK